MQKEMKMLGIVLLLFAGIVGFVTHDLLTATDVDIDCIIDYAENSEVDKFTNGYIYETYSLKDVEWLYWQKHPKSRWMVKGALKAVLLGCSE